MDLLDRLLGHDVWTTRQLLTLSLPLTDAQLDQEFDLGHRTLRATFVHIVRNVEVWSDLIAARPVPPGPPLPHSIPSLIARLDRAHADFASTARAVAQRHAWDELWLDTLDSPPRQKTFGGAVAHLLTHSMHHRAQLLYFLRKLNVPHLPEGDALTWENHAHH